MQATATKCPFWVYDDVTECGRAHYINLLIPLFVAVVVLALVTCNILIHYYRYNILHTKKRSTVDELLYQEDEDETTHLLHAPGQPLTDHHSIPKSSQVSLIDKHFSIEKLKLVKLNGEPHGKPEIVKRGLLEKTRIVTEFLLVLTQFALHVTIFFKLDQKFGKDFTFLGSIVQLIQWATLLLVVTLRLCNVNQVYKLINNYPGNLWSMSFGSYFTLFLASILPYRSICIGHIIQPNLKSYYAFQFYCNFFLFLLLFLAPIGNKLPILYRTDSNITPSPEPVASIASFISWFWIDKFVWTSHKKSIQLPDIWGLTLKDYSIFVLRKYKEFTKSKLISQKSFTSQLLLFFTKYLLLQAFWALIGGISSFIPTILLKRILEYVDDRSSAPLNLAWFYVILMFFSRILVAVCQGQALFFGRRVCIRMKSIIISEIYSKALRRKVSASSKLTIQEKDPQDVNDDQNVDADEESSQPSAQLGAIINLMSVDAFKVSEICAYLHFFVEATAMTVVALVLLYRLMGFAAIIGAILIIAMLPVNFKLAVMLADLQKQTLEATDKRIQKLNEAFQAIRIIKFFSWEDNFKKNIEDVRKVELHLLLKRSVVWAISSLVWFITPTIVTTVSFAFYIYVQGNVLTTPIAFTALSLFTLLKDPLDRFSDMLSFVVQSKVSLSRIQKFLNEEDTQKYEQLTVDTNGCQIAFKNATIGWTENSDSFKLRDMTIEFKTGKLNVVIGPTGSGKTSLLMALLGEMNLISGQIIVPCLDARQDLLVGEDALTNSFAYCSQAAWLLNDTVRNNILFNSPYREERYNAVVEACGLKRDFSILSAGDMTEIGERGITLSGGQKQRLSLARALYSNSRHLLLDDCLSAVDSHTAAWIYDNCITGPLMEGRTCILVSHNIALTLRNAEQVIFLENGRVKKCGDPLELLQIGLLGEDELVKSSILSRNSSSINIANKSDTSLSKLRTGAKTKLKTGADDKIRQSRGKLVEEETKANGAVSINVYGWYLRIFGGWKTLLALVSLFLIAQSIFISQSWWVRYWVAHDLKGVVKHFGNTIIYGGYTLKSVFVSSLSPVAISGSDVKTNEHKTSYYLLIYFAIGVVYSLIAALKIIYSFYVGIQASAKIFEALLQRVLHARLRFFDSTPIGRIMNRFSKDIEAVDQELTPYVEGAFYCLVECVTTIILITYITPQFLSVAIVVGCLYYLIGYFYMAGSRELKRFDSITKSPIHQHFSETLVGVTTIRAYGDETRFMQENLQKIDDNNKPFFYLWVANRWLSFRIDLVGALVIFGAGIFILYNIDTIDAGMAGISLTYAISFTEGALWLVRFYSDVEMNMNSVERLQEYMDIEMEPYKEGTVVPPANWPTEGKIEVNDVSLRYAPHLPKVINNISFTVEPNSKIGIVGRTGAGKSTIITALFRFLDPETGNIKIDNIDITSVDLQRLRKSVTIIPQDPTLFTGTIRSNLDPHNEFTNDDIFEALTRVNLVSFEELSGRPVENTEGSENANRFLDLENEITEGGTNLSQGQRQLMCLARSLLRSPKIILLDEATASIDYASDAKIQATIRDQFQGSTILTIAHRLRSVIDYDKILVMDAGEVVEFDHPYSLLLNKNSLFYNMCEHSGELESLIEFSKEAFVSKLNSKK